MSNSELRYLGPLDNERGSSARRDGVLSTLRRIPASFVLAVLAPTLIAAIYLLFIASPRYVSEARFIVRSSVEQQPSSLGMALQGVGLSSASTDNFAVQEYLSSPAALQELGSKFDLRSAYDRPDVDILSRVPGVLGDDSFVSFRKGLSRYMTVGYDSTTGISTLRVEAFSAKDAQRINALLLDGGEALVNRLNRRSATDAVQEAEVTLREARERLNAAQTALTSFRTRERFIDPQSTAREGANLIGELAVQLATLRAERNQLAATAPQSPQLQALDSRIGAYQAQIAAEQGKLAGAADSLAPKISTYDSLMLEREFADKLVASATAALNTAQLEARRKQLYLDQIVTPDLPDKPQEPKRWLTLLAVLSSLLVAYGIGWMLWAGVRESRAHA
ncbi:chain-length determining protein [Brevundimonas sp. SGAir0440]|uniref:chain-length determining protein n=1 Tax=Brevundimonas sp. SGAir0440 TaxID=2579977 RepID=UPI0010CCCF74|nr:chain-length determining protein [Brevundimonas sp. SGAir0440]QCQ97573.1 chain-length determining protein [Brevundimonas sp. SGAir0440]